MRHVRKVAGHIVRALGLVNEQLHARDLQVGPHAEVDMHAVPVQQHQQHRHVLAAAGAEEADLCAKAHLDIPVDITLVGCFAAACLPAANAVNE